MDKPWRAHYFQHVSFEGLASIESWLIQQNYQISHSHFYTDWQLPTVEDIDLLVVMGGPMSVNDEVQYPWLAAEKQFIREMIAVGKPILGICLGAQLIASAMGARVYANAQKEIGWWPVTAVSSDDAVFNFPPSLTVLHWHGETFDLPDGAQLLASSAACTNQAFQLGRNVIGLQFHLESTQHSVEAIIEHCRDELQPARWVQTEQQMLAELMEHTTANQQTLHQILNYLTRD